MNNLRIIITYHYYFVDTDLVVSERREGSGVTLCWVREAGPDGSSIVSEVPGIPNRRQMTLETSVQVYDGILSRVNDPHPGIRSEWDMGSTPRRRHLPEPT